MSTSILMPELSPTMSSGILSRWLVKVGDKVDVGDVIAEIETEKVSVEYEATDAGYLESIRVEASANAINVGEVIATLSDSPLKGVESHTDLLVQHLHESEERNIIAMPVIEEKIKAPALAQQALDAQSIAMQETPSDRLLNDLKFGVKISPLARRMASQAGIVLKDIHGSGDGGRITKEDIRKAMGLAQSVHTNRVADAALDEFEIPIAYLPEYEECPINNMRRTVANRLTKSSQSIPHFYMSIDCQMDDLIDLRRRINQQKNSEKAGDNPGKISINDFVIKAVAKALAQVPAANVMWAGDKILTFKEADIAIAVSLDDGLITPVIKGCMSQSLETISQTALQLIEKAKNGKLAPSDYQGGTFTISNLGMFGINQFNSIINPPQCGILSVGATSARPCVDEGQVVIRQILTLTLAMDHRCVDGVTGARLLNQIQYFIENPLQILL